ncbi:MAG: FAD-dependent oxidoreductase [Candidatus Promineifilaceae bacterium]
MNEFHTEILIVGAGLGGVAGALSALRLGRQVVLTEQTAWIGGQLTAQAVPPDENPWIDREGAGCTASYRALRTRIRDYYRRNYPLLPAVRDERWLNPGRGNVSPLCMEPIIGEAVLREMLAPYISSRKLLLLTGCKPTAAETDGDRVRAVTFAVPEQVATVTISADFIIDATELGDLLEMAGVEHVIGAESQDVTGELHALPGPANPMDQQSFTWCFAVDYLPGENHTIKKPADYEFWVNYRASFWADKQLSWTTCDPETLEPVYRPIFRGPTDDEQGDDLWHYRRIVYRPYYPLGFHGSDVVIANWPQIDYWLGPLVGVSEAEREKHLLGARQLSLSMMYWMQTEAPRHDGGQGYPGLRLRDDVVGTADGLAMAPYIRESRRILADFTVLEQHVGVEARGDLLGAELFTDSVGIGSYRIDLHPSATGRNYVDVTNWPFQIPLGALIPQRVTNLLPGGKNLGVTHITNGCYRLHPVEWNVGEASGALAAYCLAHDLLPRQVRGSRRLLEDFQAMLVEELGFELAWPEHLRLTARTKFDKLGI